MKKLSLAMLALTIALLVSCDSAPADTLKTGTTGLSEATALPGENTVNTQADSPATIDQADIGRMLLTDLHNKVHMEYADSDFVSEFVEFLRSLNCIETKEKWDMEYSAVLSDSIGGTLVNISFGARAVSFDRDVILGDTFFKKGVTYETEQWIDENIRQFHSGQVLNPSNIAYPAKVKLPDGDHTAAMFNKDSSRINRYDTLPRLNAFVDKYISGKDFVITASYRISSFKAREAEDAIQKETRRIVVSYYTNEKFMDIDDNGKYGKVARAYSLVIYKCPETPFSYRFVADGIAFDIKADNDFDDGFQELFDAERSEKRLTPAEIEALFTAKTPYYMEYICRNLGIDGWGTRDDDKLSKQQLMLNGSSPFTVLCFTNSYDTRLLFFKHNQNRTWSFIDFIDFGGRQAGTEYSLEKAGGQMWLVGNSCRGHGTGESRYYREWYTVDDTGKKLALSIPYSEYMIGPYGGYIWQADSIKLENRGSVRISAGYSLTNVYVLDIDKADEYGQVYVTSKMHAEFVWNKDACRFKSGFQTDDRGLTIIPPANDEMRKKCGEILSNNYDKLSSCIKAIGSSENDMKINFKIEGMKNFLEDCPDSKNKAALLELLKNK